MKKWRMSLGGLLILCCVAFMSEPAFAVMVSPYSANSDVTIIWDTLTFSRTVSIYGPYQGSKSTAEVAENGGTVGTPQLQELPGWGNTNAVIGFNSVNNNQAFANGWTSAVGIGASTSASAMDGDAYSLAEAQHYGMFQVSGSGNLTVSVNYNLSYNTGLGGEYSLSEFGPMDGSVFAEAQAWGRLYVWNGNDYQQVDLFNDFINTITLLDSNSASGVMSLTYNFADLDYGYIQIGARSVSEAAAAPVPLPASVWLFGPGLLGLLGFGRRSKK